MEIQSNINKNPTIMMKVNVGVIKRLYTNDENKI